jgi:Spy/CpxP family protein refolding chaperone
MNRLSRLAWPLLALSLAAVGCGSTPDASAVAAAPEAAEAAEAQHGPASLHGLLGESLDAVALRPDQKQVVDAIRADLKTRAEPIRAARHELMLAVADGVAAGKVDEAALAAPMAKLTQAVDAFRPAVQADMNKLHATLDATQRTALVAGMRAKAEGRREGWKQGGGMHHPLKKLAAELGLSDDQVATIRAAVKAQAGGADRGEMMARHEEMRDHMRAVGDAFVSETFDAAALNVGNEGSRAAGTVATHRVRFVAQVLPVLTPEQRAKWAADLRARAGAGEAAEEE